MGGARRRHALGHGLRVHGLHGERIVESIVVVNGRVVLRMRVGGVAVDPLAGGIVVSGVLVVVVVLLVLHTHMAHGAFWVLGAGLYGEDWVVK